MKRIVLAACLLVTACKGGSPDEAAQPVVSVRVAKAEIGSIAEPIELVGTITARQEATLSTKINAQIASMPLLKNRSVKRGDVLARLEARDLSAQRDEAAAALREAEIAVTDTAKGSVPLTDAQDAKAVRDAQATLANARRTLERRTELFDKGGISKKDLEASQLEVTRAEDDVRLSERAATLHHGTTNPADIGTVRSREEQASRRLANLEAQLGYATIRAPFDGVVTEQFAYQGDFAAAGNKLFTVIDASTVIVKASMSDETAARVHAGDLATVQPDDLPGLSFQGRVSLVGRAADPQSRAVEAWVSLPNGDGRLRANAAARVVIQSRATGNAVIIPSSAITLDATNGNGGTVMVVDAKSVAHEVHVTVGTHDRTRTRIVSGLHGGESVVVEGNYGLPEGTKVTVSAP